MLLFQNERRFLTFYLPKLLLVGLIWISAVVMATWQKINELQDPTYSYKLDTANFNVSYYTLIVSCEACASMHSQSKDVFPISCAPISHA